MRSVRYRLGWRCRDDKRVPTTIGTTDAKLTVWSDDAGGRLAGAVVLCRPFETGQQLVAVRHALTLSGGAGRGRTQAPGYIAPDPSEPDAAMETIRLLTFSTLYPNDMRPNHGIFVENRLRHLLASGRAHSTVVAPIPWFPSRSSRFGDWARHACVAPIEVAQWHHGASSPLSRHSKDRHVRGALPAVPRHLAHAAASVGVGSAL